MDTTPLEQILGVEFRNGTLLREALRHDSYVNEHPEEGESNERLEFLGDALVDLVAALELYRRHPELSEGSLTDLRSLVVSGEALAGAARRLGLGGHLLLGHGEATSGGRERESNLAGALEAVVGAVLLDRGYDVARRMVLRLVGPELRRAGRLDAPRDPKSELQELVQRQAMGAPSYEVIGLEGPAHRREFTVQVWVGGHVLGRGTGQRKAEAERQAAGQALRALAGKL